MCCNAVSNNSNAKELKNSPPSGPTVGVVTKQQFSHNPYGERIMHSPQLQHAKLPPLPTATGSALPSFPALTGFQHPNSSTTSATNMNCADMRSPNDNSVQSHQSGVGTGAYGGGGGGGGQLLSSPNASNTTPRLRFRWDPYSSSLHDDSNVTEGDVGGGATESGAAGGRARSSSVHGDPAAASGTSRSPNPGSTPGHHIPPHHSSSLCSPHHGSTAAASASQQPQQRQGSSLVFHTPSGSNKTAPLTVEDLLANSPHLVHVSPMCSPGLVSVDKKSLSSTHQNDGRQYYLDYSPIISRAPAPQSMTQGTPGYHSIVGATTGTAAAPVTSPGPIGGRPPPAATVRIPTHNSNAIISGADGFFPEVMPSLQLPDQAHPGPLKSYYSTLPVDPAEPVEEPPPQQPEELVESVDEPVATAEAVALEEGAVRRAAQYPEEMSLMGEITTTPSLFFAKMLPPPPPVSTLLSVCSLQSVYVNCTRYHDFVSLLREGDGMCALGEVGEANAKTTPQNRPRDRNNKKESSTSPSPLLIPFSSLAAPPPLPVYAVNSLAELETTRTAMVDWYTAAVQWWNDIHGITSEVGGLREVKAAAAVSGGNGGFGARKSSPDGKSLRGANARGTNANANANTAVTVLKIDTPSPSVQAAVKAVIGGSVRRKGDYSGGGGGGNSYHPHASGGGGSYRGRNPNNAGGVRGAGWGGGFYEYNQVHSEEGLGRGPGGKRGSGGRGYYHPHSAGGGGGGVQQGSVNVLSSMQPYYAYTNPNPHRVGSGAYGYTQPSALSGGEGGGAVPGSSASFTRYAPFAPAPANPNSNDDGDPNAGASTGDGSGWGVREGP